MSRLGRTSVQDNFGAVSMGSGEATSQARTVRNQESWWILMWPASKLPILDQQLTPGLFSLITNLAIHQFKIEVVIWGPNMKMKGMTLHLRNSKVMNRLELPDMFARV